MWPLLFLLFKRGFFLLFLIFAPEGVEGETSSPQVADVEDLFKDEGFLRMSRGGEAFGGRRPPPPLITNFPFSSTLPPSKNSDSFPNEPTRTIIFKPSPLPPSNSENSIIMDENGRKKEGSDGESYDFNPMLTNPAVTRILAGSSGKIPQWEPMLPTLYDSVPEVSNSSESPRNRVPNGIPKTPKTHNNLHSHHNSNNNNNNGGVNLSNNFDPNFSKTFNFSPIATKNTSSVFLNISNSPVPIETVVVNIEKTGENTEENDNFDENESENSPSSSSYYEDENNYGDNLEKSDENEREGEHESSIGTSLEDIHEERGCNELCGAWKHQCKLMGIVFSITSALCIIFSILLLHSLHYRLKDFLPFSIIILLLLTISLTRAFLLLSSPHHCPPQLFNFNQQFELYLILSTLPPPLLTIAILIMLHMAKFPLPFCNSPHKSSQRAKISLLSIIILLFQIGISYSVKFGEDFFYKTAWIGPHIILGLVVILYLAQIRNYNEKKRGDLGLCESKQFVDSLDIRKIRKNERRELWGCLQLRAMIGVSLIVLCLVLTVIISVLMGQGREEKFSTWSGWALSLLSRVFEFIIVILLLFVIISSGRYKFLRLSKAPVSKSNVGLINSNMFPSMVNSHSAGQLCIPSYSSNGKSESMTLDPAAKRPSFRSSNMFGEKFSDAQGGRTSRQPLPLRLSNNRNSHSSLPVTPLDNYPQNHLVISQPVPASLLLTKMSFNPSLNPQRHHRETYAEREESSGHVGTSSSNIYASLESVGGECGTNNINNINMESEVNNGRIHPATRELIYTISRDLNRTIDTIYDASRNHAHSHHRTSVPQTHTIHRDHIGSNPNLVRVSTQPNSHNYSNLMSNNGRGELVRTIDRHRLKTGPNSVSQFPNNSRNFVLQLSNNGNGASNPPPYYYSSESSHDVTPDSGIMSDIQTKAYIRNDESSTNYQREYNRRSSVEDVRRLPIHTKRGTVSKNQTSDGIQSLKNQDGEDFQRFISHKEQLEHVERLIAQAEYAIWAEKRNGKNSHATGSSSCTTHNGTSKKLTQNIDEESIV